MKSPTEKIFSIDEALAWRASLKTANENLVMTNGCFDILHKGHVEYLFKARSTGDAMILALNSDSSIKTLKGPGRPINDQNARAAILASLYFIDAVIVFDSLRCDSIIEKISPDIYVKGGDYDIDTIDAQEKQALLNVGAEIRFIPLTPGFSTTKTISKMRNS
jgi:rfaE bifunctional protein nucleotidyltransferase chain/domain